MINLKQALVALEHQAATDYRRQALQRMLLPWIKGPRVLDAGCGMGFMTTALARLGHRVVAVDIEHEFVATAIRDNRSGARIADGLVFADSQFPFADASYDTIVSLDVIEHIADDARVLQEFARLLQPQGRLVLTVPALPALFGQRDVAMGHYRRYTKQLLEQRLTQAGLALDTLVYWNALGVAPYFLAERVFHRPISDSIRQGRPTWSRQALASLIEHWLLVEWTLASALPVGLSLVVMAHPLDTAAPAIYTKA